MPSNTLATSSPFARNAPLFPRALPALRVIGRGLFWSTAAALTGLLVANTLPYYDHPDAMPVFEEKGAIASSLLWRTAFFVHVTGALTCIVVALLLFSRWLLRSRPAVHRALGWIYVASALVAVVPAGLVLVPAARGGVLVQAGFVAIGASMAVTTAAGLARVLRRDFVRHRAWMVRSYAMATTALSSRAIYVGLAALAVPTAYEIALWASIGASVLVSEAWIERSLDRRAPPHLRGRSAGRPTSRRAAAEPTQSQPSSTVEAVGLHGV